ncbi:MAG: accessory gene regulator B family protein [Firmicutes bacterium]|nr:accessory gene regulator B family protein [Bacillota bacterium]
MLTIAKIADQIGENICKKAGLESEINTVSYGVEVTLVSVISVTVVLFSGWLLGVFIQVLPIALASLLMKTIIGGPHLSGFTRCLGFSAFLITGAAFLDKYHYLNFGPGLGVVLLLVGLAVIWRWAPMVTVERIISKDEINKRRFWGTVFWLVCGLVAIFLKPASGGGGLFIGASIAIFNISPLGVNLVKGVENITKKRGG